MCICMIITYIVRVFNKKVPLGSGTCKFKKSKTDLAKFADFMREFPIKEKMP